MFWALIPKKSERVLANQPYQRSENVQRSQWTYPVLTEYICILFPWTHLTQQFFVAFLWKYFYLLHVMVSFQAVFQLALFFSVHGFYPLRQNKGEMNWSLRLYFCMNYIKICQNSREIFFQWIYGVFVSCHFLKTNYQVSQIELFQNNSRLSGHKAENHKLPKVP